MKKIKMVIKGTHCPACKLLIEDVCKDFKEVKSCIVDYKSGKTEISHDEGLDTKALKKEIESAGQYKVQVL